MPEDDKKTPAPEDDKKQDDSKKPEEEKMTIPKDKWDQMYARTKAAEREAEEAKTKLREREEKEKAEQGKHQELADQYRKERDELKAKNDEHSKSLEETNATFAKMLEAQLEEIPEDKRKLIPDNYSPKDKLSYIASNRSFLIGTEKKGGSPGQPNNDKQPPADELATKQKQLDELIEKRRKGGFLTLLEQKTIKTLSREVMELKK